MDIDTKPSKILEEEPPPTALQTLKQSLIKLSVFVGVCVAVAVVASQTIPKLSLTTETQSASKASAISSPIYSCQFTSAKPPLDGSLSGPWLNATQTASFIDITGDGPTPRYTTTAMMLWDNEYLYIGARIQDPDVWSNMQGRNTPLYQENNFEFFMDPESDGLNYYELEINSLGTTWQLSLDKPYSQGGVATNPSEINGLISKVGIQGTLNKSGDVDQGWTVEIAVPWSGISQFSGKQGPPNHGNSMRVQFARSQWGFNVDGKGTYSKTGNSSSWVWAGMNGQNTVHDPSLWGTAVFERNSAVTAIPSTSVTVTGGAGNVTTNVATVLPVTSAKSTTPRTMIFNPILLLLILSAIQFIL